MAIIAVVGGGVVVPAVRRWRRSTRRSAEYDRVYRRYLTAETLPRRVVVLLTIFAMAAKPFS